MTGAAHRAGLETPRRQTETGCDRTRRSNTASCSRVVSRTTSIGLDDRGEHGVLHDPLPHHRFETAALSPPRIMPKVLSNPRMPFVVAAALWRGLILTAASTTAVAHSCAAASLALPGRSVMDLVTLLAGCALGIRAELFVPLGALAGCSASFSVGTAVAPQNGSPRMGRLYLLGSPAVQHTCFFCRSYPLSLEHRQSARRSDRARR